MSEHDGALRRIGLEEQPLPRVVQESDQIWLKVHLDGRDCAVEISLRQAFVMAIELMLALARLCRR